MKMWQRSLFLILPSMLAGCASVMSNLSGELAYVRHHPIASPRVPLYRLDGHRRVEVEFVDSGSTYSRLWFVDPQRGIDVPLDNRPGPKCRFAMLGRAGMFNEFKDERGTSWPRHYESDEADLLVFADTRLTQTTFPVDWGTDKKEDWGLGLSIFVSTDGGRSYTQRTLIMQTPYRWLPEQKRYDLSDKIIGFSGDRINSIRFLITRQGVAYLAVGRVNVNPDSGTELSWTDVRRDYLGDAVSVFAFDPRSSANQIPVRLLYGDELRSFAMPAPDPALHKVDDDLLKRVQIPVGSSYEQKARSRYVERLRGEFPEWASSQDVKIGRTRYETHRERYRRIERASEKGAPCG